jgi:hypothetical protein
MRSVFNFHFLTRPLLLNKNPSLEGPKNWTGLESILQYLVKFLLVLVASYVLTKPYEARLLLMVPIVKLHVLFWAWKFAQNLRMKVYQKGF